MVSFESNVKIFTLYRSLEIPRLLEVLSLTGLRKLQHIRGTQPNKLYHLTLNNLPKVKENIIISAKTQSLERPNFNTSLCTTSIMSLILKSTDCYLFSLPQI